MPAFRVHFDLDGFAHPPALVAAVTPEAARAALRARYEGATIIVHKVKIDRESK